MENPSSSDPDRANTNPTHVLVIEDEESHAELIRRAFSQSLSWNKLTIVHTLLEARAVLAHDPPDLIIADWMLPDGNGIDILPRADGRVTIPLVIITSHGDEKLAVEMMKSGAIDYIVKSEFTFRDLPHLAARSLREWTGIQDRKKTEAALHASESKYRHLYESLRDAVGTVDMTGRILDSNPAFQEMLGYSPAELMDLTYRDLTPERWLDHEDKIVEEQVLVRDYSEVYEKEYRRKDGTIFPVELRSFLIRDESGKPAGVWAIVRDITERKHMERLLVSEKDRAQNLLDIAGTLIVALDTNGIVTLINKRGCEILGRSREEIVGKVWADTFLPERIRKELKGSFHTLGAESLVFFEQYENPVLTSRGEERIISWNNSVIRDASGMVTGTLSSGEDITERKRAEIRLDEINRCLLGLTSGYQKNLDSLVALCSRLFPASVIYNKRHSEGFTAIARGNTPEDFPCQLPAEGSLCTFVMETGADIIEFRNLRKSRFAIEGGLILKYGIESYVGHQIRESGVPVGSLCLLFNTDFKPTDDDRRILGIIASAIGSEEQRRSAELALRESEEEYRLLFENATDAIYLTEVNENGMPGRFLMVNPIASNQLGYSHDELLNMSIRDIVVPENSSDFPSTAKRLLLDKQATLEAIHRRKDGSLVSVETSIHLFELRGRVVTLSFCRDITERKKTEAALRWTEGKIRESEEFLQTVIAGAKEGIIVYDRELRITLWNPFMEEMTGVKAADVLGKKTTEVFPFIHEKGVDLLIGAALDGVTSESPAVEFLVLSTGRSGWSKGIYSPSYDSHGTIIGAIGLVRDITASKKMESELRESEEKFRDIFNNVTDAIQIHEMDENGLPGRFIEVNDVACEMLQCSREELLDMTPLDFATNYHSQPLESIGRGVKAGDVVTFETGHRRKDGKIVPVEINAHSTTLFGRTVVVSVVRDITERKAAENLLRENEVRLAKATELAKLVSWEYDIATGTFTFDDRFFALYGTTAEREGGYTMSVQDYASRFIHAGDQERVREVVGQTIESDNPLLSGQIEHRIIRRDGEIRNIIVHYAVVFDSSGTHTKNRGVNQDITDRKRSELALTESEEKFRTLVENVVDVFYRADCAGTIVYASPSALALTGYQSLDEIIGRPITSFWEKPQDRDALIATMARTGYVKDYEITILRADGTRLPVSISSHFYRDDTGKISGMEGVIRDISERKEYETALRESEEKFRMIFDTDQDSLIIFAITANGMPGRILDANKTATDQLGFGKDELLNKTFLELNADEYHEMVISQIAGLFTRGYGSYESVRIRKDGTRFPVEILIHRMKLDGSEVIVSSARDVSDRKRQEKSLKISNQKLQLMNIVAWHDIQNKITGLRGYVELTKNIITDEKAKTFVSTEEDILKLIDQQIQYTKEYQQMGVKPPQWIRVSDVIRRVFSREGAGFPELTVDVGDLEIFCDPTVEKAFSYLVEFTIDPSRGADKARVYTTMTAGVLTLCYEDNGTGIPADAKEEIFVRDVAKFTGFGMVFIHDIFDISDMRVRETGDPAKGARFEITVPKGIYRVTGTNQIE